MKKFILPLIIMLSLKSEAQVSATWLGGGEQTRSTVHQCASHEARENLKQIINSNRKALVDSGIYQSEMKGNQALFIKPLAIDESMDWPGFYGLTFNVDHDSSSDIEDYGCLSRSYNGHQGSDYVIWPFAWYLYENDLVSAVAAADGIVLAKQDGNYDQNCEWMSGVQWNVVVIEHNNGSQTWYGHLKNGSLTEKNVGESVEAGEFLGVIASSGFSDVSHLHFEVYNSVGEVVDPYFGTCNNSSLISYWEQQEDYFVPQINALFTHSAPPLLGCPAVEEVPNWDNDFSPGETIYLASYYRDEQAGSEAQYSVENEDGEVVSEWSWLSNTSYPLSYWYWTIALPDEAASGVYTFKADYQGISYSHDFNYGSTVGTSNADLDAIRMFPNPWVDELQLELGRVFKKLTVSIFTPAGRLIHLENHTNTDKISVNKGIPEGLYFIKIDTGSDSKVVKTVKL